MLARPPRLGRSLKVAGLLLSAFFLGGSSAAVAIRTHAALERAKVEREIGSAGQLVELSITDEDGNVVERPRLIAPVGKAVALVLHDPSVPDRVRLTLRVEAARDPSGEITLAYTLRLPDRDLETEGTLSVLPGVPESFALGNEGVKATFFALPVPSDAFDAYLEAELAGRSPAPSSS